MVVVEVMCSLGRLEVSTLAVLEGDGAVAGGNPREGEVYLGSIAAVARAGGRPVTGSLEGRVTVTK